MDMMVKTDAKGKRIWGFSLNEKELYNLLCNNIAWTLTKASGGDIETVERQTISLATHSHEKDEEAIKSVTNPFIRAVFLERKRLGLGGDYQLRDES